MSTTCGSSWRMIVELGDRPKTYGVYPGGQSGNVGSLYYDNFVDDWNKGTYYLLQFFMSLTEAKEHTTNAWILK
jgi:penicillin amidase